MSTDLLKAAAAANNALVEKMEKEANIFAAGLSAGKAFLKGPTVQAAKNIAKGTGETAWKAAKGVGRVASTPGGALGLGLGYITLAPESINPVPMFKWHMTDKEKAKKQTGGRHAAIRSRQESLDSPYTASGYRKDPNISQGKTASVRGDRMYTEDEVRAVQRISSVLMEKTAGPRAPAATGEFLRRLALFSSAGLAVGAGSQYASYGINKSIAKSNQKNKGKYYQRMLKADPSLKQEPGARQMFDVMHRASPYLASEPVIAAATVRSMMDSPVLDERRIQSLLSTEKARQETEFPWARGGSSGTQFAKDMASIGMD